MYDRIIIASAGPTTLLGNIKQAIDKGDIQTWAYDLQGDFTHVLAPWQDKAWLQPRGPERMPGISAGLDCQGLQVHGSFEISQ